MKIKIKKIDILEVETDLLVIPIFEAIDQDKTKYNDIFDDLIIEKIQKYEVSKLGNHILISSNKTTASHILLLGIGKGADIDSIQEFCGLVISHTKSLKANKVAINFPGCKEKDKKRIVSAMAQSLIMANYEFEEYKTISSKNKINEVVIIVSDDGLVDQFEKMVELAEDTIIGVDFARDLVNSPANKITPKYLANEAERIASLTSSIGVKIFDRDNCKERKMGAYLAVAQGSDEDPYFIHMTYKSEKPKSKIVIIGKGVTFDSGGLSIKPSKSMETMKCDMAGAATVLGVFRSLVELKPDIEVHGLIASAENMPSSKAIRPGDIITASNDKTVEILNTDAEGRLTLADALVYGSKLEPDFMIDLATLTGSVVVALGEEIAGIMSNDDELSDKILKSSVNVAEKIWRLPLEEKYQSLLESDVADLRNISKSRYGGTLTASLFLKEFVADNIKWAHIDIAGPAFAERPLTSYLGKGGTGFGVRTLLDLLLNL